MEQILPSAEAADYHYVECGLPNVWLRNGFEKKQTPYGEGVSISDIERLRSLDIEWHEKLTLTPDETGIWAVVAAA